MKHPLSALLLTTLLGCQPAASPAVPNATTASDATPAAEAPAPEAAPAGEPQAPAAGPAAPAAPTSRGSGGRDASTSLGLTLDGQAANSWRPAPALQVPRHSLIAANVSGSLLAAEGAPGASIEVLGADGWALDDRHHGALHPESALDPGVQVNARYLSIPVLFEGALLAAGGTFGAPGMAIYAPDGYVKLPNSRFGATDAGAPTDSRPVYAGVGGGFGGTVIIAGGLGLQAGAQATFSPDAPVDATQRFDVEAESWSFGAPMPVATAGACGLAVDGRLWVFGGYDAAGAALATVQAYDPDLDTWTRSGDGPDAPPPMPVACHSAACAVLGGKVYVVGGVGADGGLLDAVQIYDPATRAWTQGAPLPTPRALLALAAHDQRLWAIAGRDATGEATRTVEVYRP